MFGSEPVSTVKDCWLFGELGELGELVTTLTEEANCCGNKSEKKIEINQSINTCKTKFIHLLFVHGVLIKLEKSINNIFG